MFKESPVISFLKLNYAYSIKFLKGILCRRQKDDTSISTISIEFNITMFKTGSKV